MRELRNRLPKSRISSSFFFLIQNLTSIADKLKQLLSLVHTQNDIAFVVVAHFTPFVCKLARVAVLASCGSAKFWQRHFQQHTKGRGSDLCLLHMRSSHAITFRHSLVIMVAFEVLNESLSIRHLVAQRPLGGIPTNLYLSVSTVTLPSWRRGFLPRRGFLSWRVEYVSSEH